MVSRRPSSKPTRLEADQLPGERDVGPGLFDVARARRLVGTVDRKPEEPADRLGERVHGLGAAGCDVEHRASGAVGSGRSEVRVDDVRDVREVARLLAVPVDRDGPSLLDRLHEERHDGRVLGRRDPAAARRR